MKKFLGKGDKDKDKKKPKPTPGQPMDETNFGSISRETGLSVRSNDQP